MFHALSLTVLVILSAGLAPVCRWFSCEGRAHSWAQHGSCGLTSAKQREKITSLDLHLQIPLNSNSSLRCIACSLCLVSPANLLNVHSGLSSRLLMKTVSGTGLSRGLWGDAASYWWPTAALCTSDHCYAFSLVVPAKFSYTLPTYTNHISHLWW